ncbi:MAG TPA: DUF6496 domain-containing protein [Bacteroidia bacterium]|nr:DUF6496 domain-containing protein [Bacteroidia bacterium]
MAKYGKKTQELVGDTMRKMKRGELKSGKEGKGGKVNNKKQAIAIALSEAREKGYKAPPEKSSAKKSTRTAGQKSAAAARSKRSTAAHARKDRLSSSLQKRGTRTSVTSRSRSRARKAIL